MEATTLVKERPILFGGPMVRALLAGTKTQTRRIIRNQPPEFVGDIVCERYNRTVYDKNNEPQPGPEVFGAFDLDAQWGAVCPYGQPGDRLWVRETCRAELGTHRIEGVRYIADDCWKPAASTPEQWNKLCGYRGCESATVPPIHMPRWASRLLLEITAVRVERVQDISKFDAVAEGVESCIADLERFGARARGMKLYRDYERKEHSLTAQQGTGYSNPADSFESLWASINGNDSWAANPWVWVVEFKVVSPIQS